MATRAHGGVRVRETASYAKRISTHIAYALVAYTLLLIFEVSPQMESDGTSILPYFLLVILVGLVIMPCRNLERRWQRADDSGHGDLDGRFKRDMFGLWLCAIGIPTALALLIWVIP